MHAQPTYEDQLEPVIIHKQIFNGLRKFACSKVPKRRYVSLLFDIHPAQEINPDIKPDADNPTRVVIFAVSAINDQAFQPLGYVFLHETTPAKELSDCIKRYIADLLLCELVVINTICPPSNYLKTAVENLVTVGKMKNKTEAHVINVWDSQIFHLYDAPSMLAEIRKEFKKAPASFRQYNTNFTAYYEDVEKVVKPVSKDDILSAVKLFSMTSYHKIIDEMRVSGHSLKEGSAEICAFFDILFDTFYGDNSSNNRNRMPLTSSSVHEAHWKNSLSVLKSMSFIRSSKSEVEEITQQIKNDDAVDTVRDVINMVADGTLCVSTPSPHETRSSQEVDNKPTKKKHKKKHAKHSENKTLHDNTSEINNSSNTNHCNFNDPTDMLDSQNNISYLENVLEGTGCDVNVEELNKSLNVPDTEELKHRKQKEKIMYAAKKMIDVIHSVGVQNANECQVKNFSAIKTKTLDDCDTKKLDERIEKSDWMENIMKKYKPVPHDENNQTSVKKTDESIANKNFKVQNVKNKETSRKKLSNKTSTTSITSKNNVHFSKKGKQMPKHNESTNAANEHVTCTNNYIETMNQSNEFHNSRQTFETPLENQDTPPKENSPKNVSALSNNRNIQQMEKSMQNVSKIDGQGDQQMKNESQNIVTPVRSKNIGHSKKPLPKIVHRKEYRNSNWKKNSPKRVVVQQIESSSPNAIAPIRTRDIQQMDNSSHNAITKIKTKNLQKNENSHQKLLTPENLNTQQIENTTLNPSLDVQRVTPIDSQGIQQVEDCSQNIILIGNCKVEQKGRTENNVAVIKGQNIQEMEDSSQKIQSQDIQQIANVSQNVIPTENRDINEMKITPQNVGPIGNTDGRQLKNSLENVGGGVTNIKIKNNQNVPRSRNEKYQNGQQKTPKRVVVQQIETSPQNAIAPIRTRDIQQMENSSHNAINKIKSKNLQQNDNSHQKLLTPENLNTQQIENTTQNILTSVKSLDVQCDTPIDSQHIQQVEDCSQSIISENRKVEEKGKTENNVAVIKGQNIQEMEDSSQNIQSKDIQKIANVCKDIQKIANVSQNVMPTESRDINEMKITPQNVRPIGNTDSQQLKNSLENVVTPTQENGAKNMKIKNNQNVPCSRNEKYRNGQQKAMNIPNIENTGKENSVLNEKVNENDANSRKVKVSPDHNNIISTDEIELDQTEFQNLIANGNSHNNDKLISPLSNISNSQVKTISHNTESYKNDKNKSTSNSETESKNKISPITSKPNDVKEIGKSQTSRNLRIERENETVSFSNKRSLLPVAYINIKIETKMEKALEPENRQEKVLANGKKSVPKKPSNPDDSIDIFNRNIRKYYQGIESKPKPCIKDVHIVGKESHKEFEKAIPKETENKSKIQMDKTVTNIVMNGINESESNITNSIKTNDEISLVENKNSVICTKTKTTAEVEENLMISTTLNVETENVKKENIISNKTNDEANLIVRNEAIEEYSIILDTLEELENMQTEFSNMKQHYQYTMEICNKVMDSLTPDGLLQAISKEDLINIITTIPAGKDIDTVFSEIVKVSARPLELLADSSEKFLLDLDMIYSKLLEIQNFEATLRNNEDGAVNYDTKTSYDNATKEQDTPMEIDPISEDEVDIPVLKDSYRPYVLDAWMISINGMREIYKSMNAKRFESINTRHFNLDPLRYLTNELKNANQIPTVRTLTSELQLMDESLLAVFYSSKAGITLE